MANQEHVEMLLQGMEAWHRWRKTHRSTPPDLSEANLSKAILSRVNLKMAYLSFADLSFADLSGADLSGADLSLADLSWANISGAKLSGASLIGANLSWANLSASNLFRANLSRTDLTGTNLSQTDFTKVKVGWTRFGDVDLSAAQGLDSITHYGPSYVDVHTIYRSEGKIPEVFLRGAGLPEAFIAQAISLGGKAVCYYSCFISYSHKDEAFAKRLYADLQQIGVRCWYAPEDIKIGDRIRPIIDQSIRMHDKLLLILSKHSIDSTWVEKEVETAFEEEEKHGEPVLFPIRLDSSIMDTQQAWAADIRRTRHIGDFSRWTDDDSYRRAFTRLLRDLKMDR
jgi:hypothetical protein